VNRDQDRPESRKNYYLPELTLIGLILCFFVFPGNVFAGLILDAELRLQYEDNVVGLLSDQQRGGVSTGAGTAGGMAMLASGMGGMGGGKSNYTGSSSGSSQSPGDFSATLFAEAGGYQDVGGDAEVFAKGFALHTSYDTYTDLNSNIGGVSTGVSLILSDLLSTRMSVLGKIKRFDDSQRNSTAYAGNLSLKEKLTSSYWLREYGQYEKNNADTSVFSYTGTTIGMEAGYAFTKKTLATLGYSYLVQKYDEPSGAEMKTQTVYVSAEQTMRKNWAVSGEYDLQLSKENVTGTSATNNIFSLALRYSY
jgi:hypothetical protein